MTLEVRRLNPDGRDPTEYLRRMFEEVRPDVVNILPSPYDFATARVENRINELFGVRIGRMARWVEKRTTRPSTAGRAGRINRLSRRIAHRFIGARPDLTREQVERTFEAVYRFLAQQEDVTVVVRESPRPSSLVRQQNPSTSASSMSSTRSGSGKASSGISSGRPQRNNRTMITCAMAFTRP
ncbi:MAG: hypothetical protein IPN07_06810 [Dehalococcoidia bacterium]|nr:hypothetical protein [Dehalococcoidia bacterium]